MAGNLKDLKDKVADITKRYVHNICTRTENDKMDQNLSVMAKTMGPGLALFAVSVAVELVTKHNMTQGMSPTDAAELLRQFDASLPRATDLISDFKNVITFNNDLPMHTNIRAMGWFSTLAGGVAASVKLLADAATALWGEKHAERITEIGEEIARKGVGLNDVRKTGAVRLTEDELHAYMDEIDASIERENTRAKPRHDHFADQIHRITAKETGTPHTPKGATRIIPDDHQTSPSR
jgi:hypothetical protein